LSDQPIPSDDSESNAAPANKRLRTEISWTLPANIFYGMCLSIQLLVLNKLGSPLAVGRFGLALAIAAPLFFLANLRLAQLLATDMRTRVNLVNYFLLRSWLIWAALFLVGIALNVVGTREITIVLILVSFSKAAEGMTELCHAAQQRIQRVDRIAISLFANGIIVTAGFCIAYALTNSLEWAVTWMIGGRLAMLFGYDLPMLRKASRETVFTNLTTNPTTMLAATTSTKATWFRSLELDESIGIVKHALPLGITGLLLCLTSNIPRYIIVKELSEHALGIFCTLAAALQAGNLIFKAIEQPTSPRMAQLLKSRNAQGFWSLTNKLMCLFLLGGAVFSGLSLLAGPYLLGFVLPEYAAWSGLLALLFITSMGAQIAGMVESCLIAARITAVQLPIHLLTISTCFVTSLLLVPKYGLYGAVLALIICRIPYTVIGIWLLHRFLREPDSTGESTKETKNPVPTAHPNPAKAA